MGDSALLRVTGLKKAYSAWGAFAKNATIPAVDGVSLSVARGETLGLVGESGCGKTTLGRIILRLIEPDEGSIEYDGADITRVNMRPYRRKMQIIFQDPYGSLDPRYRIRDIVAEGMKANNIGASPARRAEMINGLLRSVGIDMGMALCYPHELSGGQQQRVGIARALAVDPEFIICDEPVSSLDVSHQSQILNLLLDLQNARDLTYLFISHDLSVVRHVSDRIAVMYSGKIVEMGPREELIHNPAHSYTKTLLAAIPALGAGAIRIKSPNRSTNAADIALEPGIQEAAGCRYLSRCGRAARACLEKEPELKEIGAGHFCACHIL